MRQVLTSLLLALTLAACPGPGPEATPDTGKLRTDAAAPVTDAAVEEGDASTATGGDASVSAADASTATPDGGGAKPDGGTPKADAGTTVVTCEQADCMSNEDCSASDYCKSFSDTVERRCCVAGNRGTKPEAASCTADSECAFGRCIKRDDGAQFCSGYCESDLDCTEATMQCSTLFKWCYPRDVGAPPESCSQISLDQCFNNDNCDDNQRCENKATVADPVLCCTVGARGTGAVGTDCTSELNCAFGRCLGGKCSEACDIGVDPCSAAGMVCNEMSLMCEPP
ncbi:MAG: hypothetical protein QM765_16945 [Myxococcales bacterium]